MSQRKNTGGGHLSTFSRIKAKRVILLDNDCWKWTGYKDKLGYGHLIFHRAKYLAHRLFYERLIGPIPNGLVLHHECRNPWCVNPQHVRPVSKEIHGMLTSGILKPGRSKNETEEKGE